MALGQNKSEIERIEKGGTMPKLVNIEGEPMLELSRKEVFGIYLSMGHGKEYAERMTRTVMTDYSKMYLGRPIEEKYAKESTESSAAKRFWFRKFKEGSLSRQADTQMQDSQRRYPKKKPGIL